MGSSSDEAVVALDGAETEAAVRLLRRDRQIAQCLARCFGHVHVRPASAPARPKRAPVTARWATRT